ncbi:MAG: cupredoxin family copper-binding protein [Burkholderiales bacterium]|nr:cupredoxin family copper-binding protein [Burkholderiales bacterium]
MASMPPMSATTPMARAAESSGATAAVDIRNFAFVPAQISVNAGARVVWTNRDDEAHLVVSTDGAFKPSPALDTDDTFAMVFDKPGTYPYFCAIHPMMRGTVVVR